MTKYKVPIEGSGTLDDPYRLKYKAPKNSKVTMYPSAGYAIVEVEGESKTLEKHEDVEKVE